MTTTSTETLRFRGICNTARYDVPGVGRKGCDKVVRFWTGELRTAPSGRTYGQTRCEGCDQPLQGSPVKVTHSDAVVCDAKCYNAVSAGCTCSCDGDNHGKAHERRGILS